MENEALTNLIKRRMMLVISRKEGEGFKLILESGVTVEVRLERYEGQQTKVSIQAPKEILVLRDELLTK